MLPLHWDSMLEISKQNNVFINVEIQRYAGKSLNLPQRVSQIHYFQITNVFFFRTEYSTHPVEYIKSIHTKYCL